MATWERTFSNGTNFTHWIGRLTYVLNSQNTGGNYSNIYLEVGAHSDNGAYTQNGLWDARAYVNGGQVARSTPSTNIGSGYVGLTSWSGNVGHDANGNLTINIGDYINAPVNEMTQAGFDWGLPRIALAPSFSDVSVTPGTITPNAAGLRAEITGYGHGTSATFEMFYRLQGSGTWLSLGQQGDAAGYNFWTASGLVPGKTYEYTCNVFNNNGDTANSGTSTFTTLSVPGMVPVLLRLLR